MNPLMNRERLMWDISKNKAGGLGNALNLKMV